MKGHLRRRGVLGAFLLLFCLSWAVHADGQRGIFWEVKGKGGTLYLLGSVHMLRPEDSQLPSTVQNAYESSKALVMELDLNDVNMEALLGSGMQSAMLPGGSEPEGDPESGFTRATGRSTPRGSD